MSFIADLKHKFFRRRLEKELAERRPSLVVRAFHPDTAKVLAILFPADDADDRKAVEELREERRKVGLQTKLLGYFSTSVGEQVSYDFPFFTVKQLSWCGVPTGNEVTHFLSDKCDILYVLGKGDDPKMDYLTRLKTAGLRVGPFTHEDDTDNPFNVQFIQARKAKGLKEQLHQINRIFKIINVKTAAAV